MKALLILIPLTLYAPFELTRVIVTTVIKYPNVMEGRQWDFELALIWVSYLVGWGFVCWKLKGIGK